MTLAHTGHWLVNLLYVLPLVVIVGLIAFDRFKERRNPERGGRS